MVFIEHDIQVIHFKETCYLASKKKNKEKIFFKIKKHIVLFISFSHNYTYSLLQCHL